jgi:uncharacterized protein YcfL
MKKHILIIATLALMAAACGETTDTQETKTATETTVTEETTVETDSVSATEIDNTTVEIKDASAEVDSLINEI